VHGGFPVVAVAALVTLDRLGRCQKASVALGGVEGTPVRVAAVEQAITEAKPTPEVLAHDAELVKQEIEPESDVHASAEYRRHVASVLTRRTLQAAVERVPSL
jgi:CO/xanthine dehydrogenase FAD-binding subunit